jgi:positive regulator of sigma E activity
MENIAVGLIVALAAGYLVRRYYRKFKSLTDPQSGRGDNCCGGSQCGGCDAAGTCGTTLPDRLA